MDNSIYIRELKLPDLLVELIKVGKWEYPKKSDNGYIEDYEVFYHVIIPERVTFFPKSTIQRLSEEFLSQKTDLDNYPIRRGAAEIDYKNGERVVRERVVPIAHLLDFSKGENPGVSVGVVILYYKTEKPEILLFPDDPFDAYWDQVAPDFETFAQKLGLV